MKLAIVTPLPPQHTGIADYASDLITELNKNDEYEIDLFSNAGIDIYQDIPVYNIEEIDHDVLSNYDVIIYQMGNNVHFHLYMVELMKKYRGIVHLHDMVLHHTFAWITFAQQNQIEYFSTIEKWYGFEVRKLLEEMVDNSIMPWDSKIVTHVPLFEEFIQYADACIVHSDFARVRIKARFPYLDIYKIEQLYKMDMEKSKQKTASSAVRFGIFGGVDPQKRVDTVLDTFAQISREKTALNFHLNIVGGIDERCNNVIDLRQSYSLEKNVTITGRVDEKEFMDLFMDTDVLIALRHPTMGETSAVVMRAMQLGIPCIVNDTGWYGELPEHVIKISTDNIEDNLKNVLSTLLNNEKKLKEVSDESIRYSKEVLDFNKETEKFSQIIHSVYNYKKNKHIYCELGSRLRELGYQDNSQIQAQVINSLDCMFSI